MSRLTSPCSSLAVLLRNGGLLAALWLVWAKVPAIAQSGPVVWSEHTNLSDSPEASAHPAIVADDYGLVHVFWSEEVGGRPMAPGEHIRNTGNSVMYRCWDGQSWSAPMDVLYVPGESRAEWPVVAIDAESRLHVLWESMTRLYYSSAPSWEAGSAPNWTEPLALTLNADFTPWGASITADAQGILHVIYVASGDEEGLNYLRSSDAGESWGLPTRLYAPSTPSEAPPSMVQIVADGSGRLHAVWQTNQDTGSGRGVYYARSTDGGEMWAEPVPLATYDPGDFSVGTPYLMAHGASELHLIYVGGAYTGSKGRFHRISTDGGATWGTPRHIITELVGMNGYVMPIVDGAGQMHLIANMRTEAGQVVGIYYSRWQGADWTPVVPIDVSIPQIHYTAATVRLGNELHIVYNQLEGAEVWHIQGLVLGLSPQPAAAPPTLSLPTPPAQATATTQPLAVPHQETVAPPSSGEMLPSDTRAVGIHPLLPAAALALVMVAGAIAWTRVRSR